MRRNILATLSIFMDKSVQHAFSAYTLNIFGVRCWGSLEKCIIQLPNFHSLCVFRRISGIQNKSGLVPPMSVKNALFPVVPPFYSNDWDKFHSILVPFQDSRQLWNMHMLRKTSGFVFELYCFQCRVLISNIICTINGKCFVSMEFVDTKLCPKLFFHFIFHESEENLLSLYIRCMIVFILFTQTSENTFLSKNNNPFIEENIFITLHFKLSF